MADLVGRIALAWTLLSAVTLAAAADGWQSAALWGADVRSLMHAPLEPDLAFAGTSSGQVYRSDDGGSTWADAGEPLPFPGWVVVTLQFDPDRPQRLWAGLRGVFGGGLLAWSEDHGRHWTVPAGAETALRDRPIYALARPPGSPGRVYAGTRAGVLRSDDEGSSWRLVSASVAGLVNVSSLWVDAGAPQIVLAGTFRRAFRSEDGGETWRGVFDGMVEDTQLFTLQSVPGRPGALWASTCGWVYETADRGDAWTRRRDGLSERRTPSFAVLGSSERLLAGTVAGAFLSTDGGAGWSRTTDPDLAVVSIAFHPARPLRVLLGTEGAGIWRSDDGGHHFRRASEGLRSVRASAAVLGDGAVWVAVNHAGPASGLYRSADGAQSFEHQVMGLPTVLGLASAAGSLWAATESGLFAIDPRAAAKSAARRVEEIGARRVDQVVAGADRVVARAGGELFERRPGGRFERLFARSPTASGPVASIAFAAGALWASDEAGLVRVGDGERRAVAAPVRNGHLESLGSALALNGGDSLWLRSDLESPWQEVATGQPRLLPTGDERWPALVVAATPDGAAAEFELRLAEAGAAGWTWRRLEVPVPERDVLSALVVGDRLVLATSGYGVVTRSLAP